MNRIHPETFLAQRAEDGECQEQLKQNVIDSPGCWQGKQGKGLRGSKRGGPGDASAFRSIERSFCGQIGKLYAQYQVSHGGCMAILANLQHLFPWTIRWQACEVN